MIKFVLNNKKVLSIVLGILFLATMVIAIVVHSGRTLGQIKVDYEGSKEMKWLSKDDIVHIIKPKIKPEGLSVSMHEIKPAEIKSILEQNPYVEGAKVYVDANNDIHILIKPSDAILRVFNNNHVGYYISSKGNVLPLSTNFTPRVCVASGGLLEKCMDIHKDLVLLNTLYFVASKINADSFMRALSEQIVIDNYNNWIVIPKWGKARIYFGDTSNWDDKVIRLKAFYQNVEKDKRWRHYKVINLTYNGQVVCERSDVNPDNQLTIDNNNRPDKDSLTQIKPLAIINQHKNTSTGSLNLKHKSKRPVINNNQNKPINE